VRRSGSFGTRGTWRAKSCPWGHARDQSGVPRQRTSGSRSWSSGPPPPAPPCWWTSSALACWRRARRPPTGSLPSSLHSSEAPLRMPDEGYARVGDSPQAPWPACQGVGTRHENSSIRGGGLWTTQRRGRPPCSPERQPHPSSRPVLGPTERTLPPLPPFSAPTACVRSAAKEGRVERGCGVVRPTAEVLRGPWE